MQDEDVRVCGVTNETPSVGSEGVVTKMKPFVSVKNVGKVLVFVFVFEMKKGRTSPQVLKVTSQSREDDKRAPASLNCHHTLKTNVNEYNSKNVVEFKKKRNKGFTAVI